MKKTLFILLVLGYCAAQAQVYNRQIDGTYQPAKIIFGDGVVYDMKMEYRSPEYFKNPQNRFSLAKSDGTGSYKQTGGIEAFTIDGWVWAQRNIDGVQQFVAFIRQGAIEEFYGVVNGKMGTLKDSEIPGAYLGAGRVKRYVRNNLTNETLPAPISLEKVREWISNSPEAMEDLKAAEAAAAEVQASINSGSTGTAATQPAKKGLLGAIEKQAAKDDAAKQQAAAVVDLERIINNYNVTYESRNPGELKYYFAPTMNWITLPTRTKSATELKAENQAKSDALWAGRSNTITPELASAKDNVPVKKETFSGKLSRIKADGNKVGVWVNVMPARSVKNETVGLINYVSLEGEYLDETLRQAGQQLVDELNSTYNTTDFELIDINKIPYKEVKVFGSRVRVDDWWSTKYKVVFKYTIDPRLEGENKEVSGQIKFVSSVNFLQMLMVTEYIGPSSGSKRDILTQILNFGAYRSPYHAQDDQIKEAKEMYEKVMLKLDGLVLNQLKAERADEFGKMVKRLGQ